jgi:hypothetical protein
VKMVLQRFLPILLCLVVTPVLAAKPYDATYTVHYNGFKVGEMHQRYLPQKDGNWLLQTKMKTTGLVSWFKSDEVVESSVVGFETGMPRPLSYTYHYTGNHKDVTEKLDFDWQKRTITSLRDGKTEILPLRPGVQDKQSYQLAMRKALHKGVKDFVYSIAERGKIETYELQVVGEEPQVTTFGTVDTLVVKKGTTTLWLAKDYDYLVVKIEQHEDGNIASSYITSKRPFAVDTSAIPAATTSPQPQAD